MSNNEVSHNEVSRNNISKSLKSIIKKQITTALTFTRCQNNLKPYTNKMIKIFIKFHKNIITDISNDIIDIHPAPTLGDLNKLIDEMPSDDLTDDISYYIKKGIKYPDCEDVRIKYYKEKINNDMFKKLLKKLKKHDETNIVNNNEIKVLILYYPKDFFDKYDDLKKFCNGQLGEDDKDCSFDIQPEKTIINLPASLHEILYPIIGAFSIFINNINKKFVLTNITNNACTTVAEYNFHPCA